MTSTTIQVGQRYMARWFERGDIVLDWDNNRFELIKKVNGNGYLSNWQVRNLKDGRFYTISCGEYVTLVGRKEAVNA